MLLPRRKAVLLAMDTLMAATRGWWEPEAACRQVQQSCWRAWPPPRPLHLPLRLQRPQLLAAGRLRRPLVAPRLLR